MSRIRTTLDSVTKAVSSTDLISKFSRFKPAGVTVASSHEGKAQKEALESGRAADTAMPETTMKEEEDDGEEKDSDEQCHLVKEKDIVSWASSSPGVAKQTMQLFHPAALSTNMDETYKTLAQHINSYFGTSAQREEDGGAPMPHRGHADPVSKPLVQTSSQTHGGRVPVLSAVTEDQSIKASPSALPPSRLENVTSPHGNSNVPAAEVVAQSVSESASSTKKGLTHYLSHPRPTVQAFVGSYIAPLVPKFRGEAKSVASERDKTAAAAAVEDSTSEKAVEELENEEEKAKRKLLLQREKVCGFKPKCSWHIQTYFS